MIPAACCQPLTLNLKVTCLRASCEERERRGSLHSGGKRTCRKAIHLFGTVVLCAETFFILKSVSSRDRKFCSELSPAEHVRSVCVGVYVLDSVISFDLGNTYLSNKSVTNNFEDVYFPHENDFVW
jgi:hypothetical protein